MAEERRGDRQDRDERPESAGQAAPVTKQKKKSGKARVLFPLLLLALGVGAGLHFSGLWDARPLVWGIVPQLPYVGKPVARFFHIPEQYTLTVAERRAFELEEWQKRLDARERGLSATKAEFDAASGDVAARAERLARAESSRRNAPANPGAGAEDSAEQKLIDQVVRTYQDMSSRNAAQIVEQLRDPLAVRLLQKLPNEARASILGKMDPKRAARLTELMTVER
ncbi:MAG: MgtE intracellular region [Synergistaceae bacterium]|jgi:flagellar motility protein MotE (MotC chaperone)|nr:MgtE intracellular region [Synergistaceae bacterium]